MSIGGDGVLSSATSTFDLYDFFSMLLPGVAFLIGMFPFAPSEMPLGTFETLLVLIVVGYILGRAIHSAAESLDPHLGEPSHRAEFDRLIRTRSPSEISEETLDAYYTAAQEQFDYMDLPDDRTDVEDGDLKTLYVHTRALIHRDGQGRSRTFQAIYAFYRSVTLVAVLLAVVYFIYGMGRYFGAWVVIGAYTSHLGALQLPFAFFQLGAEAATMLTYLTFHDAKGDYRTYFLQYLIVDFLIILGIREGVRPPAQ
ncbi:hypothetical protein J2752_000486 [Halarchaeum rubridurum]|uniref:Uncharacterized protein n=1 Tax=Halarchaeum rubridurum TaxID=489911 RepID=A0A830FYT8_9EURY|nr:hypothetical protein [Halarchaeum rubridurum]MBP1953605.1 hypothetical protein [Halarchaeum rubridurum]GGM63981.1 hypothetical protein GCM10009017_12580 [Halarchaeum rubridurum]